MPGLALEERVVDALIQQCFSQQPEDVDSNHLNDIGLLLWALGKLNFRHKLNDEQILQLETLYGPTDR